MVRRAHSPCAPNSIYKIFTFHKITSTRPRVKLNLLLACKAHSCLKMQGLESDLNINYLCTYDLNSPVHNVLDACISITRASGKGLDSGIREFFGP
jgi:hypothetical protein